MRPLLRDQSATMSACASVLDCVALGNGNEVLVVREYSAAKLWALRKSAITWEEYERRTKASTVLGSIMAGKVFVIVYCIAGSWDRPTRRGAKVYKGGNCFGCGQEVLCTATRVKEVCVHVGDRWVEKTGQDSACCLYPHE